MTTTKLFMSGFKKKEAQIQFIEEGDSVMANLVKTLLWSSYFQLNLLPAPVEEKLKIRRKKFENKFRFNLIVKKDNQMWNPFSNREENPSKRQH